MSGLRRGSTLTSAMPQIGSLQVEVVSGSGAALSKGTGFFSEGVICTLTMSRNNGSGSTQPRKPAFLQKDIVWNQQFKFPVHAMSDACTVTCTTGKTFIGRASISMSTLPLNKSIEKLNQLYCADGEPAQGVITLRLKVSIDGVSVSDGTAAGESFANTLKRGKTLIANGVELTSDEFSMSHLTATNKAPAPKSPTINPAASIATALSTTRALTSAALTRSRDGLEPTSSSSSLRRGSTVITGIAKPAALHSFTATSNASWYVDPDDTLAAQANAAIVAGTVDEKLEPAEPMQSDAPADVPEHVEQQPDMDSDLTEQMAPASRLIDYVLLVGVRDDDIGAAVLSALNVQSSRAPEILQQYPPLPRTDVPLSAEVAQFCLPEHEPACVIAPSVPSEVRSFGFTLTDAHYRRSHGASLVFWEQRTLPASVSRDQAVSAARAYHQYQQEKAAAEAGGVFGTWLSDPAALSRAMSLGASPMMQPMPVNLSPSFAPLKAEDLVDQAESSHAGQLTQQLNQLQQLQYPTQSSSDFSDEPLYLFVRRSLSIVSRHAFTPQYRSILTSLYRLFAVPPPFATQTASAHQGAAASEALAAAAASFALAVSQSSQSLLIAPAVAKAAETSTVAHTQHNRDPFSLKAFSFSPSASTTSLLRETQTKVKAIATKDKDVSNKSDEPKESHRVQNIQSLEAWLSAIPSLHACATVSCGFFASLDRSGRSLEQYLVFLCEEVPVPSPGGVAVEFCLGTDEPVLRFALPAAHAGELPHTHAQLTCLFDLLDAASVIKLLAAYLCERRILFRASSYASLMNVAESVRTLAHPFEWPHIFVPVLPRRLLQVLDSDVPFVVGVHSSLDSDLNLYDLSRVVVVDLDAGTIECDSAPRFPPQMARALAVAVRKVLTTDARSESMLSTLSGALQPSRALSALKTADIDVAAVAHAASAKPSLTALQVAEEAEVEYEKQQVVVETDAATTDWFDNEEIEEVMSEQAELQASQAAAQKAAHEHQLLLQSLGQKQMQLQMQLQQQQLAQQRFVATSALMSPVDAFRKSQQLQKEMQTLLQEQQALQMQQQQLQLQRLTSMTARAPSLNRLTSKWNGSVQPSPHQSPPAFNRLSTMDSFNALGSQYGLNMSPNSPLLRKQSMMTPDIKSTSMSSSPHISPLSVAQPAFFRSNSSKQLTAANSRASLRKSQSEALIAADTPSSVWLSAAVCNAAKAHDELRWLFLHFLFELLADYRSCLVIQRDGLSHFNAASYLQQQPTQAHRDFMSSFVGTHLFGAFLDRHIQYPHYMLDLVRTVNETRMHPTDEIGAAIRPTFFLPLPEPVEEYFSKSARSLFATMASFFYLPEQLPRARVFALPSADFQLGAEAASIAPTKAQQQQQHLLKQQQATQQPWSVNSIDLTQHAHTAPSATTKDTIVSYRVLSSTAHWHIDSGVPASLLNLTEDVAESVDLATAAAAVEEDSTDQRAALAALGDGHAASIDTPAQLVQYDDEVDDTWTAENELARQSSNVIELHAWREISVVPHASRQQYYYLHPLPVGTRAVTTVGGAELSNDDADLIGPLQAAPRLFACRDAISGDLLAEIPFGPLPKPVVHAVEEPAVDDDAASQSTEDIREFDADDDNDWDWVDDHSSQSDDQYVDQSLQEVQLKSAASEQRRAHRRALLNARTATLTDDDRQRLGMSADDNLLPLQAPRGPSLPKIALLPFAEWRSYTVSAPEGEDMSLFEISEELMQQSDQYLSQDSNPLTECVALLVSGDAEIDSDVLANASELLRLPIWRSLLLQSLKSLLPTPNAGMPEPDSMLASADQDVVEHYELCLPLPAFDALAFLLSTAVSAATAAGDAAQVALFVTLADKFYTLVVAEEQPEGGEEPELRPESMIDVFVDRAVLSQNELWMAAAQTEARRWWHRVAQRVRVEQQAAAQVSSAAALAASAMDLSDLSAALNAVVESEATAAESEAVSVADAATVSTSAADVPESVTAPSVVADDDSDEFKTVSAEQIQTLLDNHPDLVAQWQQFAYSVVRSVMMMRRAELHARSFECHPTLGALSVAFGLDTIATVYLLQWLSDSSQQPSASLEQVHQLTIAASESEYLVQARERRNQRLARRQAEADAAAAAAAATQADIDVVNAATEVLADGSAEQAAEVAASEVEVVGESVIGESVADPAEVSATTAVNNEGSSEPAAEPEVESVSAVAPKPLEAPNGSIDVVLLPTAPQTVSADLMATMMAAARIASTAEPPSPAMSSRSALTDMVDVQPLSDDTKSRSRLLRADSISLSATATAAMSKRKTVFK